MSNVRSLSRPLAEFGMTRFFCTIALSSVASSGGTTPAVRVVIPFTPLLVSQYRKVPLSAFGRVRDDTVLLYDHSRLWGVWVQPLALTAVLILSTPLLVNEHRKVPLSTFGRVRDDTHVFCTIALACGEFGYNHSCSSRGDPVYAAAGE